MEDNTVYQEEFTESATEIDSEENAEGIGEVRQDVNELLEETEHENEIETVSGGDSVVTYDEELTMILNELISQREDLDTLQEYLEYQNQNIYEKPLEDYTVTESLLLITMFVVLFGVLIKLIGGIVTCKI